MAFSSPTKVIAQSLSSPIADGLKLAGRVTVSSNTRIVARVTLGLQLLHAEIQANRHWPTKRSGRGVEDDEEGRLIWSEGSSIVVLKRYKLVQLIGRGAFSDVFLADDLYVTGQHIAIKVFRAGFEMLGHREKVFLEQHLSCLSIPGPTYVVRSIGFTELGPHFCCLLQYYPYTLMSVLVKATPPADAEAKPEFTLPSNIVKPQCVRKLFGKDKAEHQGASSAAAESGGLSYENIQVVKKLAFHLLCALS
eukprot:gene40992-50002_t